MQSKTKIIFLDVDGVLNNIGSTEMFHGYYGVDQHLLENLKAVVDATGAKIVLSSSWKRFKNPDCSEHCFYKYLEQRLASVGLEILDITPESSSRRGFGILKWIHDNEPELTDFIIIDDGIYDFKVYNLTPHWLQTSYKYNGGLSTKAVECAIKMLNSGNYDSVVHESVTNYHFGIAEGEMQ